VRPKRWRTGLAVFLLVTGGILYVRARIVAARPSCRVLSDTEGTLRLVACGLTSARKAVLHNARLVSRIANALPPRVRMVLLTNDREVFAVLSDPWPGRVSFVELPSDIGITIWPQDPFLVLRGRNGRTILLVSREFDRACDRDVPDALAGHFGWEVRESELCFEGGNIVVGPDRAFIGANTIRYNALALEQSGVEVARRFEQELGRPVLVIGPAPQPIGHLDMCLTPLDAHRVVLADPGWGADLAERALKTNPGGVEAFERWCEEHFFGLPGVRELLSADGHVIRPPRVVGMTAEAIEDSRSIDAAIDRVAKELRERGYEVARMPYLSLRSRQAERGTNAAREVAGTSQPSTRSTARNDEDAQGPRYPELTYNNVLLDRSEGRSIVYLPQYGWEALDRPAREQWAKLGFEVHTVQGLTTSAMFGGSLRCCVKVLARDE